MKRTRHFTTLALALILVAYGCSDDNASEVTPPVPDPDPITPDLGVKVKASVTGFISDESGNPVTLATVTAGSQRANTDEYGYFQIEDTSLPKVAGLVTVEKDGYYSGYATFLPQENNETFVRVTLLTREKTGTISAATGGTVNTTTGARITLPANGVATASNGAAYTGDINISARILNNEKAPGDARGIDDDGHLKALKTFSAIAVELTDANGNRLQIASDKTATISLPIPAEAQADAPNTVALWYFETESGLWKQEGTATKNGTVYEGSLKHFSFWQGAEGVPLVNFTARITNAASQPLANVAVIITPAGAQRNSVYSRFGHTDANGYVTGPVFANANLVLEIRTTCAITAYEHQFATAATDINLGTLIGNLGQNNVVLSGTVTNCNDQPVAYGHIQTYDNGFYNRVPITNGNFSYSGIMCTNTSVNLVVVDYATFQQNTPQTVSITPGTNALGTLKACGTYAVGRIAYSVDSGPTVVIQETADTMAAYYLGNATQILTLSGEPNTNQKMAFQITGPDNKTGEHTVTDILTQALPGGRGNWPVPIKVTITEYGKVGGYISGSFSSQLISTDNNNYTSVHTLTCTFKVRRVN